MKEEINRNGEEIEIEMNQQGEEMRRKEKEMIMSMMSRKRRNVLRKFVW